MTSVLRKPRLLVPAGLTFDGAAVRLVAVLHPNIATAATLDVSCLSVCKA